MKTLTASLFCMAACLHVFAQVHGTNRDKLLSDEERKLVFTDSVCRNFMITFPISTVYQYKDRDGLHYIVLSENPDTARAPEKNFNKIKAVCFTRHSGALALQWQLNDFVKPMTAEQQAESSIWFWTKYLLLEDLDRDGYIDPVVVYGSSGDNRIEDGRIKIIIFHRGQKIAIRHQNGVTDYERNTQIDKAFYQLSPQVQERITNLMKDMMQDQNAIFPAGWEVAMKKKMLKFDER